MFARMQVDTERARMTEILVGLKAACRLFALVRAAPPISGGPIPRPAHAISGVKHEPVVRRLHRHVARREPLTVYISPRRNCGKLEPHRTRRAHQSMNNTSPVFALDCGLGSGA